MRIPWICIKRSSIHIQRYLLFSKSIHTVTEAFYLYTIECLFLITGPIELCNHVTYACTLKSDKRIQVVMDAELAEIMKSETVSSRSARYASDVLHALVSIF